MTYHFDIHTAPRPVVDNLGPQVDNTHADTTHADTTHADTTQVGLCLTHDYDIGDKPNGGYVLSAIARAMATRVGHPHPCTITGHYLRPSSAGPGVVLTDVAREGRSFSTVSAGFVQDNRERVRAIATFADVNAFAGPTMIRASVPEIAPIEQCVDRRADGRGLMHALAQHVLVHTDPTRSYTVGHELEVRAWIEFADGRPVDVWALPLFADACPPTAFGAMNEPAWVPTVELTMHIRNVPVGTRIRARFTTRFLERGLCEEDGELWDERGVLVAQSRQLAMVLPAG